MAATNLLFPRACALTWPDNSLRGGNDEFSFPQGCGRGNCARIYSSRIFTRAGAINRYARRAGRGKAGIRRHDRRRRAGGKEIRLYLLRKNADHLEESIRHTLADYRRHADAADRRQGRVRHKAGREGRRHFRQVTERDAPSSTSPNARYAISPCRCPRRRCRSPGCRARRNCRAPI